jgi:predicted sulfurtransferase
MDTIILFYKYVDIQYPKQILKWQKKICQDLNLKGRIFLAHEGINGTLGGNCANLAQYKTLMEAHPLFGGIDFKESAGDPTAFPRLYIVMRNEIVHMGIDPQKITARDGGEHLDPTQVHELLTHKPDNLVILDGRNNYESRIGKFTDAISPDVKNFRDFPAYIDNNLEQFKDKEVLMYCTGGIRCERASAYLKSKQVAKKIYQIKGGIHRYIEQYPDGFFRGKNYVFDARIAVKVTDDVLSTCDICKKPCDEYTNCLNANCNKHYIGCTSCVEQLGNACSPNCTDLINNNLVPVRPPLCKPASSTHFPV